MLPSISGFEYESGYEYILRISRTDYLDYSMGEPAWTEYALIEEISKEAKASENVPDNFIPEWFFEQHCADLDESGKIVWGKRVWYLLRANLLCGHMPRRVSILPASHW